MTQSAEPITDLLPLGRRLTTPQARTLRKWFFTQPRAERITVTADRQDPTTLWEESVEIDFRAKTWCVVLDGERWADYRNGVATTSDGQHPAKFSDDGPSLTLGLVMRRNIYLWGRHYDDSNPIFLEQLSEAELLVTFEHKLRPAYRSTLTWNLERGMFTELVRFASICRIRPEG